MAKIDWEKERQRLIQLYSSMEDGQLSKLAADYSGLNDVAREVLGAEKAKRGLTERPTALTPAPVPEEKEELPPPEILRRYLHIGDALIGKSVLDSAGIESMLADDNLIRMDWFVSNAVGGVKLIVRHEDAEAAANILEQGMPEGFDAGEDR
jgi:hypothetical protein